MKSKLITQGSTLRGEWGGNWISAKAPCRPKDNPPEGYLKLQTNTCTQPLPLKAAEPPFLFFSPSSRHNTQPPTWPLLHIDRARVRSADATRRMPTRPPPWRPPYAVAGGGRSALAWPIATGQKCTCIVILYGANRPARKPSKPMGPPTLDVAQKKQAQKKGQQYFDHVEVKEECVQSFFAELYLSWSTLFGNTVHNRKSQRSGLRNASCSTI